MTKVADLDHQDVTGQLWRARANDRFQALGLDGYMADPEPLPDFEAGKPDHADVALGFYVVDSHRVVHRVQGSTPDCGIATPPRTFVHFWHEVRQGYPGAEVCERCQWPSVAETEAT